MDIDENRIADLDIYLTRMQRSILDKMFFIDKVFEPFEYILDFGCANGELIKAMQPMFPGYSYLGYDISSDMIEAARANVTGARFYDDWESIDIPFDKCLLNISSTIHEVYSYGSAEDIDIFWKRVFDSGFRYITIRDMSCPESMAEAPCDEHKLSIIRDSISGQWLESFENVWGKVKTKRDMVHFLLKYKYTMNWEREVHENYLPITTEELMSRIPDGYRVVLKDSFALPYISWQIRKDFGFDLDEHTHIKLILEKI